MSQTISPENSFLGEVFTNIHDFIPIIYENYYISNYGRIYDIKKHAYKNLVYDDRDNSGNYYARAHLHIYDDSCNCVYKYFSVHRLVMACFVPGFDYFDKSLQVNHKDFRKDNNYYDPITQTGNLEIVTPSENMKYNFRGGITSKVGENNSCCKITEELVIKVADMIMENKYSDKEIVDIFGEGLTTNIVSNIRNKNSWTYLTKEYQFPKRKTDKNFTEEDIHNFCKYLSEHKLENKPKKLIYSEALELFGFEVNESNLNAIAVMTRGITYKDIRNQYNF